MIINANSRKAAVLVLLSALAVLFPAVAAAPQEAAPQSSPAQHGLSVLWQRSVDPLVDVALSPQGEYLALITADGRLTLWSAQTGKSDWAMSGIKAHDAVVSDQLGAVVAYDDMNRLDRRVTIYRAPVAATPTTVPAAKPAPESSKIIAAKPGATLHKPQPSVAPAMVFSQTLGGAVWTASVSLDGSYAACVTGDRKLHLIALNERPSLTSLSLDGIGNDLEFSGDNSYVAVGLWDESGVETVDMAGRIRWSYLGAISRRYEVAVSPDSRRVLSISYRNPNHSAPVLTLLNGDGTLLWTFPLGTDAYGAYARVADGAGITFVSYTAIVRTARKVELERRLIALGPAGDELWRRGGLFFKPTLLFVAPDDKSVIVYDGIQYLYRIDLHGNVTSRDSLPGQLEYWSVSYNRTRLVTYTSDGQLTAYKVK